MRTIELLVRTFLTMNISDVNVPAVAPKWNGTNDYPYYASIQVTNFEVGFHECSGVLLDPSWVLTVAHCIEKERSNTLWVVVGEKNLYEDKSKEDYHEVDFYVKHPQYLHYRKPFINDIALVHLKKPVTLNEYVQTFEIRQDKIKGPCKEIEWKENRTENLFNLKKSTILYKGNDFCHEYFTNVSNCEQNFCGLKEIIDNECETNTGNVLVCDLATGEKNVVGLASWVDSCDKPQKPIVYVRISFFASWIKSVMEGPAPRGTNVVYDNGDRTPGEGVAENAPRDTETNTTPTTETTESNDDDDDDDDDDEYNYESSYWR